MAQSATHQTKLSWPHYVVLGIGAAVFVGLLFAEPAVLNNDAGSGAPDQNEAMSGGPMAPEPGEAATGPVSLPAPELNQPDAEEFAAFEENLQAATAAEDSIALLQERANWLTEKRLYGLAANDFQALYRLTQNDALALKAAGNYRKAATGPKAGENEALKTELNGRAIAFYKKYLANNPDDQSANLELALCQVDTQAPMQGILKLREIAENNPENYRAQFYLGLFSLRTNQMEKAVDRLEKAIAADSSQAEAYYYLGSVLRNQPSTAEEGLRYLNIALEKAEDEGLRRIIRAEIDGR